MKRKQKFAVVLAAIIIISQGFSVFATEIMTIEEQESTEVSMTIEEQESTEASMTTEEQESTEVSMTIEEQESAEVSMTIEEQESTEVFMTMEEQESAEVLRTGKEQLEFHVELQEDVEKPGWYGTLNYIPEGTWLISVLYSFNGMDYYEVKNNDNWGSREWNLDESEEEGGGPKLTQLCIGENDHPFKAFKNKKVNSLYIRLVINGKDDSIQTDAVKQSHEEYWAVPDQPPEFLAEIESTFEGYVVKGTVNEFLPNTTRVRPMYSLDGENYKRIQAEEGSLEWGLYWMGTEDSAEQSRLHNQICVYSAYEPLKSYLKQEIDHFYIKLEITNDKGENYDTQAALIERGTVQPIPENATASANFTPSMLAVDRSPGTAYTYGKYQITVRENSTAEEMYKFLPPVLPIEVQIIKKDSSQVITSGIVKCEVSWKELPNLEMTAGQPSIISDAANELVVPAGTEVSTPLGIYVLEEDVGIENPYARDEIRIVVNPISAETSPDVSLSENRNDNLIGDNGALSLAFRLKPSGASSIKAYSYVEGTTDWIEICDLISRRDIDANQSEALYGFVDILQPDEWPYVDYLEGETEGLLIGIKIEGGTFDRCQVILPWPGEYNAPPRIPEMEGAGGNENNAGMSNGSGDSTEGGQRPNLPKEEKTSTPKSAKKNEIVSDVIPPKEQAVEAPISDESLKNENPELKSGATNQKKSLPLPQKEQGSTISAESQSDIDTELFAWNEQDSQEYIPQKEDTPEVKKEIPHSEKTSKLPAVAVVLVVGGGAIAVSLTGAGSIGAKLMGLLKKLFFRS